MTTSSKKKEDTATAEAEVQDEVKVTNVSEKEAEVQEQEDEVKVSDASEKEPGKKSKKGTSSRKKKKPDQSAEIEALNQEIATLKDKQLRLYAEFENYKKRTQKERIELFKTAHQELVINLLPVLDDFDRALKSIDESSEVKALKEGVELIHEKFKEVLQQKGLKAMEDSTGKDFDVDIHEAIAKIPAPSEELKGKIVDEIERGYLLADKVIRHSKVVIGE